MSNQPVSRVMPKPLRITIDVMIITLGAELIVSDWHKHAAGGFAGGFIVTVGVLLLIFSLKAKK
jgi:multisubunit Na+/H+ antiporter MnhB subunit